MPTPLAQLRKNWKKLLADNKWAALFDDMEAQLQGEAALQLLLQRRRHQEVHEQRMLGTLSDADAKVEFTRITEALFHLIGDLAQEGLGSEAPVEDPLDALLRELRVDIELSPLYLVNCDRQKSLRFFRSCFGRWQETPCHFQFYYILACPTQEPEGFAERLVYELAGEYADNHFHSVNYPRSGGEERVRIEQLPLGLTANDAKEGFKKYFAERFDMGNTSFEDYLRTGLPRMQLEYVATALSITAGDWDPNIMEGYLQWLMDAFSQVKGRTPTFLFFFVIWLKNAHFPEKVSQANREVLESVTQLVGRNESHAALITPLPPVPADDLEEWLEKLGDVSQEQKNAIIQAIAARLQGEELERFQSTERLLDMEPIENLQERVWRVHHAPPRAP